MTFPPAPERIVRAYGFSPWTDARVARLKEVWGTAMSAAMIALELGGGLTRHAVIGKAHRIGLATTTVVPRGSKPGEARNRSGSTYKPRKPKAWDGASATDLPTDAPTNPVTLQELERHHCRWPCQGTGADVVFCGGDVLARTWYCARHCRMAYTNPRQVITRAEYETERRRRLKARAAA